MRGFIDNLLVDAAAQRRGIGRALMERTEAYFRERGLVGMQTGGRADNEVALRLYASMGYRVVEEYVRRRRVPVERRVRMWKEFAPRPQPPL